MSVSLVKKCTECGTYPCDDHDTEPMRRAGDLLADMVNAEPLIWDGQRLTASMVWEAFDVEPGDTVSMGTFGMLNGYSRKLDTGKLPPSGSHLSSDAPTHVQIPYTSWGDYCGSTVERSNARALVEDWPDTFIVVTGGFSSEYLALGVAQDIPAELYELITGLDNYPLVDDEAHSNLEQEISNEMWDAFLWSDIRHAFSRSDDVMFQDIGAWLDETTDDETVSGPFASIFWTAQNETSNYPECEDAVSAYWPNLESEIVPTMVPALLNRILSDYGYPLPVIDGQTEMDI